MTYGIALKNSFDDNLVDQAEGKTYYRKSTGVCRRSNEVPYSILGAGGTRLRDLVPASGRNQTAWMGVTAYVSYYASGASWLWNEKIYYATPAFSQMIYRMTDRNQDRGLWFANPVSTNVDDIIFFRMPPDGIMSVAQTWIPFTGADKNGSRLNIGLHAYCVPYHSYNGANLSYLVVSNDLPPVSNGNYGLRVYGADGTTILFDTTREIASFVDHISITASQAENIIMNGASLTINLRRPVANAWIAAPGAGGTSFRSFRSNREHVHSIRVQQTSPNQIVVSRAISDAPNTSSVTGYDIREFQNALFLIGDFG